MSRVKKTEECWPTETREEVLARIEAEHGPGVARVVAKDWDRNEKGRRTSGPRRRDPRHNWYDGGSRAQKGMAVRGRER